MHWQSLGRLMLLALAGLIFPACDGAYLSDDIDIELQFSLVSGPSDELHLPYVAGTEVTLTAHHTDADESTGSWHLVSSDSRVLRIDSQAGGRAECTALAPGQATIKVYERPGDSHPIHSSSIEVMAPTRAELYAHGPLLLDLPPQEARVAEALVLVDGTATFLVRYFNDDTRLYGNGVLRTRGPDSVTIEEKTTFLFENREWLQITPRFPEPFTVELEAAGVQLGSLLGHGLPLNLVDHVELLGQNESDAEDGDLLVVLAQAYDAVGRPIFGSEFSWDLDGEVVEGQGDLFRYEYQSHSPRELSANLGSANNVVTINASDGYVSSTSNIGCSTVPGAVSSATPLFLFAWLLVVACWRLARRRSW